MMLNPEESIPKDEPMDEGVESEGRDGYSIVVNCYGDGTHDVFAKPLEAGSEQEHPDGMFGLESLEDALKAVIALKKGGPDYKTAEESAMMGEYGRGEPTTEGY